MKSLIAALLLAGALSLPVSAATVSSQVDFTGGSAMISPLPTGSFVYDPGVGFISFFVNWNGTMFDMTPAANAPILATSPPTGCDSEASDHLYGFLFMTQAVTGSMMPPGYGWAAIYFGGSAAQFSLVLEVTATAAQDVMSAMGTPPIPDSPMMDFGMGAWTTSQITSVPEPATFAVSLLAVLARLALHRRKR